MKHKSILQAERLQLLQRLESNKRDIQEDILAIRNGFAPLITTTNTILNASKTINTQPALVELAQLGISVLPGKSKQSKILKIIAQIALPIVVTRFLPGLARKLKNNPGLSNIIHMLAVVNSARNKPVKR